MSNKLIDKERLKAIWEEIKMLDIFEIAKEEGIQEGKTLGIQEGRTLGMLEDRREMVTDMLIEKFGVIPPEILKHVRNMQSPDVLKMLFKQALKCGSLKEFESVLEQVV